MRQDLDESDPYFKGIGAKEIPRTGLHHHRCQEQSSRTSLPEMNIARERQSLTKWDPNCIRLQLRKVTSIED
jgi:hypothetical protein